jgi:serine/threonine protein kinase/Tol biopolymer transport system component
MPLTPGTRLGTCEIVAPLGAGGMGEVYRARDIALGREVAVKVLPAAFATDPDRLRRFTQEAQAAAALNHPNILAIFHVGQEGGAPYIVSELLEGESLRDRLRAGPLPVRKAVEYAIQVAAGLASAHDRGIVHRDLKPENLFLTRDGRVKILDFGLAKLITPEEGPAAKGEHATVTAGTGAGMVLGTVGYMSPEQVRAQAVDARSDLFSLGAILYEMVSGKRAFHGETPADTLSAILKEEPPALAESGAAVPPALDRIVRHCLEKNPYERFQTARDLSFQLSDLTSLSSPSSASGMIPAPPPPRSARRSPLLAAGVLLAVAAAGAVGWWAHKAPTSEQPTFQRLTFRRGTLLRARFEPDGKTVLYGAAWDGHPPETFAVTPDSPESRSLGQPKTDVYAVSSTNEIALSLRNEYPFPPVAGTLARMPALGGAAPRELLGHVEFADWGPNETLAVTLDTGVGDRLEYPIGTPLYEVAGAIHDIRLSPDGERVAFLEYLDGKPVVSVIDRKKQKVVIARDFVGIYGLAWHGNGEVWMAARTAETSSGIYAATLSGSTRLLVRLPVLANLEDLSADGRLLLAVHTSQGGIRYHHPGTEVEQDLSWLDGSALADISADGQWMLFSETGEAGGPEGSVYLRKTDGSPAVRLGDGFALGLSPDGKWALAMSRTRTRLVRLPVGVGEPRTLPGTFARYWSASWLPDGRVLVGAMEAGHDPRYYVQDVDGQPKPISPEGLASTAAASPDGKRVVAVIKGQGLMFDVTGGAPQTVSSLGEGDSPLSWSADGRAVFVGRDGSDLSMEVYRVDLASGSRTLWRTIAPADRAGLVGVSRVRIGPDGQSYAYSYTRRLGDLYLVTGLH